MNTIDVEMIKMKFPPGTRILLKKMNDPYPVPPNSIGTVDFIDDEGQIHIKWDDGHSSLAIIPGVDEFQIEVNE